MGLAVQVTALLMLGLAPASLLVVPYVMVSQALSGVAKDLTKMSSKSAVKLVAPEGDESALYRWVAMLTGSKNALKGIGFFLGALLLATIGFRAATLLLAAITLIALIASSRMIHGHLGTPDKAAKFRQMFSSNRAVNVLAAARIFLFCSRDVWFVVGLPVLPVLRARLELLASRDPARRVGDRIRRRSGRGAAPPRRTRTGPARQPDGRTAVRLALPLALCPAAIAIGLEADLNETLVIIIGLIPFGIAFAMNSAVHSYLILAYSDNDRVAMNVGFYYMANAFGRLAGTVLSGALYQWNGLTACLWASTACVLVAGALSLLLPSGVSQRVPPRRAGQAA